MLFNLYSYAAVLIFWVAVGVGVYVGWEHGARQGVRVALILVLALWTALYFLAQ